ncbi:esterase/lipase family protein [Massilia horti]|uniref:GPI inositol-deacylase PGAP1-like alpha/beta domain-containing protein n=1 Tax=Massilia horti TaxID=2562153 RepID=A0A4Y9T0V1_9BURK|nr:hypothetical protein [Massilia horti]TFW32793.1 hypothetical protein E4O92_08950 [Massilia horti]
MTEPTRRIPQPTVDVDGSLVAHTTASATSYKVRARVTIGSRKVIPVIFVPGIMGTNLRARTDGASLQDSGLKPGEVVWRPPNGVVDGVTEIRNWHGRTPAQRQKLLNPAILEVDDSGDLDFNSTLISRDEMKARGWGELHAGSYGDLMVELQRCLDHTFKMNRNREREIRDHWKRVMQCKPSEWGVRSIQKVTEQELEKYAGYQYPVYAVGYNWLQSCAVSAQRLSKKIDEIKEYWNTRKHQCEKVILITHSMGGFVARACARQRAKDPDDPADIAAIIHGVMPALGAPVAYRRMACGTEGARYWSGMGDNIAASAFAVIAGDTTEKTMPVMAVAPGVLELLPNQFYPGPWLNLSVVTSAGQEEKRTDLLGLPQNNPYDLYRDLESWYRVINPALADPAQKYDRKANRVDDAISKAIKAAEDLHRNVLARPDGENGLKPYYHPNSYVFYGDDAEHRAFGEIRWVARQQPGQSVALTPGSIRKAKFIGQSSDGVREVEVDGGYRLRFHTDVPESAGDDTVPRQSGAGPQGHVREIYATRGYGHQESFQQDSMLMLTRHLIVKIVQGFK